MLASLKKLLKSVLPEFVLRAYRAAVARMGLFIEMWYDLSRYATHSTCGQIVAESPGQLEASITASHHIIEKALTLPEPRLGFGQASIRELLAVLGRHAGDSCLTQSGAFQAALGAVEHYLQYHADHGYPVPEIESAYNQLQALQGSCTGGTRAVSKSDVQASAKGDFEEMAASRASVRAYSGQPIDRDLLEHAIRIAQRSPSACNRQCARVYVIKDPAVKRATLALQSGNRGFGETADTLLVVAADVESFFGVKERHQAYTDGGLFSMSLLLALHYVGLGACPLAWCPQRKTDMELRTVLPLRDSEVVIMFIAVGHLREEYNVAVSTRKELDQITRWVGE